MALIRTGVVLALGIALMPADKEAQDKLYQTTANAVQWTATFCERNGDTCDRSAAMWDVFKAKAHFAAGLAYDAAMRYAIGATGQSAAVAAPAVYAGTLTPSDLEPDWRGHKTKPGI